MPVQRNNSHKNKITHHFLNVVFFGFADTVFISRTRGLISGAKMHRAN